MIRSLLRFVGNVPHLVGVGLSVLYYRHWRLLDNAMTLGWLFVFLSFATLVVWQLI